MIVDNDRKFISLKEARDLIPGRPDISTVHRWATVGISGVRLETFKVGGRRFVTKESIDRFIELLNRSAPIDTSSHRHACFSNGNSNVMNQLQEELDS